MNLPLLFQQRMKQQLQQEYQLFLRSYEEDRSSGLRVNLLKQKSPQKLPFSLTPVPWAENGFYYPLEERPGKHPYFEAGLYYIQEPSAMAVATFLAPEPGEKILDLCAAPGGKTTHIASMMDNKGLLISNEIHPGRAKILSQNMERMGMTNAVVTNETPDRLALRFPGFFDRILVDAPCSGEGMFRKDPQACEEWSPENVEMCAKRQLDILMEAEKMLTCGGRLVYSTCTFAPAENEGVISRFLDCCPWMQIEPVKKNAAFSDGRADWIENPARGIEDTVRIWPHIAHGEGHFIAVLKKTKETAQGKFPPLVPEKKVPDSFYAFAEESLSFTPTGSFLLFGENLYLVPQNLPDIKGLKIIRPGLHLGSCKKNRFEPSHALAMALSQDQVRHLVSLSADAPETIAYLKGETLHISGEKGWTLVSVDGFPLGWGKWSDGILKNHYPKGLRWV